MCSDVSPKMEYQGPEILAPQENNENDMSLVSITSFTKEEKSDAEDNNTKDMLLVSSVKGSISDAFSSGLTDGRSHSSLSFGIAIDLLEEKTNVFEAQIAQFFQCLDAMEQLIQCPNSSIGRSADAGIISTPLSSKVQPPPFNPPPANQPVCQTNPLPANQPVCPVNLAGNLSDLGNMVTSEQIKLKYSGLHSEAKIGSMAVKLGKESIFGEGITKKSTMRGCRNLAPLPENGLKELKELLLTLFPQYSQSPTLFEPLWAKSLEAVGQACKCLRNEQVIRFKKTRGAAAPRTRITCEFFGKPKNAVCI